VNKVKKGKKGKKIIQKVRSFLGARGRFSS